MGDYTPKLARAAQAALEAGETLLAGVRGMSAGSTAEIVGGVAGGVAGGAGRAAARRAVEGDREEGRRAETEAGLPDLPPQIALGLTDRRLLIFKRGGVSGKARDLVASVPRGDIDTVEGEDSGSKLKPDRLRVGLKDGSAITFEIVKADDLAGFVGAFRR